MRPSRLMILSLASLALGGCSSQAPWHKVAATAPPSAGTKATANKAEVNMARFPRVATVESNSSYRLDSGDRVRVVVAGQDALSNSYDVDVTGSIEIPSVGMVAARGLNAVQLSGAIARRLKQNNVSEPHVAVQVETFRPFSIRGDVNNPGQYPYVNNMTTETAIAIAGGLKSRADKKSVTVNSSEQDDATPAAPQSESPVQPGDTVTVTEER